VVQVSFSGTVRVLGEELISSHPERNGQAGTSAAGPGHYSGASVARVKCNSLHLPLSGVALDFNLLSESHCVPYGSQPGSARFAP